MVFKHKIKIISLVLSLLVVMGQITFAQDNVDDITKIHLQAVLTPPYVIGPGDGLTIVDRTLKDIFNREELYTVTVSPDGYISVPLPSGEQKELLAAGYTISEISNEIRKLFSETLINPQVYVQVSKYRPVNVYIGGAVQKPGFYKIERTSTNERGGSQLSDGDTFTISLTTVIQVAGGLQHVADLTNISITRGVTGEKLTVNLKDLITGQVAFNDINLQPGDAIYISETNNLDDQAYTYIALLGKLGYGSQDIIVYGEVNHEGKVNLPSDATFVDAIAAAGGPNFVGNLNDVEINRINENGNYETFKIDVNDLIKGGVSQDALALKPNDIITVNPSKSRVLLRFGRSTLQQSVPLLISTVAGAVAGYVVQDNFFSRITKAQRSINGANNFSNLLGGGGSGTDITIIGGTDE
ncbi:MAG: polysaccharide biosynthesis/export family protein [Candidatus Melainabacteria bacterium]|nr:polysaccharide biosynthesis/export family protein [Candidatus Melainabacteria bacterium]